MVSVFAVIPLVGWDAAVVTIPIVNGGIVATNLMVDAALAKGATMAAALGTLAYGSSEVRRYYSRFQDGYG